jgi:hypothetical protein
MSVFIAVLGTAFAAFVVWLAVRIVNRRERWAKRTALLLVIVPTLYVLSIGPFVWLATRRYLPDMAVGAAGFFYGPVIWIGRDGPAPLKEGIEWYVKPWEKEQEVNYYDAE